MWDGGLQLSHRVSSDSSELYIAVGAPTAVLDEEAEVMNLAMRMKETKGLEAFGPDKRKYFVSAPDGSCFNSAQKQQIVMHR